MIEINLLPRELKKKGRGIALDKNLIYGGAIAGILVVLFVVVSIFQSFKIKALDEDIAEAKRKMEELRKTIELVDALTDLKGKLLQRMSAIENLDENRASWVSILDDLSQRVPDYLWLSSLKEQAVPKPQAGEGEGSAQDSLLWSPDRKVDIEGHTYSINSLAVFMIQLMRSDHFKNMELEFITKSETEKHKTFAFGLSGDLVYKPEPEVESPDEVEIAQK